PRRARCADRLRRAAGDSADDPAGASGGVPAVGVPPECRPGRSRGAPGAASHRDRSPDRLLRRLIVAKRRDQSIEIGEGRAARATALWLRPLAAGLLYALL